jgi:hypothetical protein
MFIQKKFPSSPLPRLDDVFDAIGQANATIYTKLDLTSAYFQLGLDDKSKHKTAFITHDNLYQFKRMPYGLNNVNGSICLTNCVKHIIETR